MIGQIAAEHMSLLSAFMGKWNAYRINTAMYNDCHNPQYHVFRKNMTGNVNKHTTSMDNIWFLPQHSIVFSKWLESYWQKIGLAYGADYQLNIISIFWQGPLQWNEPYQ